MNKYDKYKKSKFYAETEYIDIETGEVIDKTTYIRENYYTINTIINYESNEEYIRKKYQRECKKSGQTKLEL